MEVTYTHCAGLDVHKKSVVACCLISDGKGRVQSETRTFGTMTAELLALSDWLTQHEVTHVAMESTGEYWKPIYNLLEGSFILLVVNASHMKQVPGRKTDVKDAAWIADLLRHGLLRSSFIPPRPQRELRDLTRQRTNLTQERTRVVQRLHKVLEWANLKLASVASNVLGVSARAMLEALLEGQRDVQALAELAHGRLRSKRAELEQALAGRFADHHRFLLIQHLAHIDFLDEQIQLFDEQITTVIHATSCTQTESADSVAPTIPEVSPPLPAAAHASSAQAIPWEEAVAIWDSLPGIGPRVAQALVAEMGTDLSRFPSAAHLASWAGLAPGNHESAGKRLSGRITKGNTHLRSLLVQAAWAAIRAKGSVLAPFYGRLKARRGAKKAIVAVAHKLLRLAYILLHKRQLYSATNAAEVEEQRKGRQLHRLRHAMEKLGYTVTLDPLQPTTSC